MRRWTSQASEAQPQGSERKGFLVLAWMHALSELAQSRRKPRALLSLQLNLSLA